MSVLGQNCHIDHVGNGTCTLLPGRSEAMPPSISRFSLPSVLSCLSLSRRLPIIKHARFCCSIRSSQTVSMPNFEPSACVLPIPSVTVVGHSRRPMSYVGHSSFSVVDRPQFAVGSVSRSRVSQSSGRYFWTAALWTLAWQLFPAPFLI